MPSCKDCKYFVTVTGTRGGPDGYCHRYPPRLVQTAGLGDFPGVKRDDGCGEFFPRTPPSETQQTGVNETQ